MYNAALLLETQLTQKKQVPQYEPTYTTWEKAQERRRRIYEKERHRTEAARAQALQDQARDRAEEGFRLAGKALNKFLQKAIAGVNRRPTDKHEEIRRCVGGAALFLGAMAAA